MKVFLLAPGNSIHAIKWANSLAQKGIEIFFFSLYAINKTDFHHSIKCESFEVSQKLNAQKSGSFKKLYYIKAVGRIKQLIKEFNPDLVHSHYASSYGLLGALSGFYPFYVSVWGDDIISFSNKSFVHRLILKYIFSRADKILSTSRFMADILSKFSDKKIYITPFGIDTDFFKPGEKIDIFDCKNAIVIGTIKGLEPQYGIEYLIDAFSILKKRRKENLKLLIVGKGSLENKIKNKIISMNLEESVYLTGFVPNSSIVKYHNTLDIYAALSVSESFGVAILEASACGKPVVVSKIGGLTEVVKEGHTGFYVEEMNPSDAADKIETLIENPELRVTFGKNGRELVEKEFEWSKCLDIMLKIYNEN